MRQMKRLSRKERETVGKIVAEIMACSDDFRSSTVLVFYKGGVLKAKVRFGEVYFYEEGILQFILTKRKKHVINNSAYQRLLSTYDHVEPSRPIRRGRGTGEPSSAGYQSGAAADSGTANGSMGQDTAGRHGGNTPHAGGQALAGGHGDADADGNVGTPVTSETPSVGEEPAWEDDALLLRPAGERGEASRTPLGERQAPTAELSRLQGAAFKAPRGEKWRKTRKQSHRKRRFRFFDETFYTEHVSAHAPSSAHVVSPETLAFTPIPSLWVERMRAVLERMVGGMSEPSPRWDKRKVATKIAGYLRPWDMEDRRKEAGRPSILVLPDVSGSMSGYADEMALAAWAAAALGVPGADVIVAMTVNGHPFAVSKNASAFVSVSCTSIDESMKVYNEIIRGGSLTGMIIFGDDDGEEIYAKIIKENPTLDTVLWVDVYKCRSTHPTIIPQFPPPWANTSWETADYSTRTFPPEHWTTDVASKVKYAYGVGSGEEAIEALEKMLC